MPGPWHELNNGGEFTIAGWQEIGGDWNDVEKGDTPFERAKMDAGDLEIIVFHYHDPRGNDVYYTIYGPWEDLEGIADIIEWTLDRYGVE